MSRQILKVKMGLCLFEWMYMREVLVEFLFVKLLSRWKDAGFSEGFS